jgi:hypothetical protein
MWEEIASGVPDETAWQAATERWWHPELLYEEDPKWPGAGAYRGATRCAPFSRAMPRSWVPPPSASRESLHRTIGVVVLVRVKGDSAAGVPWDHLWGYLCRTRAGQLEYLRAYWNPDEALADAGVSSP